MRFFFLQILCAVLLTNSTAQVTHWTPAGIPIVGRQVHFGYIDTVTNQLYVGGELLKTANVFDSLSICVYNGSTWDTLGSFNNQQYCITRFNNELIVGGFFSFVNGVPVSRIARFDGITWHAFGNFNHNVLQLKIIGGELYAVGQFDSVDAMPIHGIAKWTGSQWVDVHAFPWNPYSIIVDIVEYNSELYVAGNFNIGGVEDMMYYHNGSWQQVGQGFQGFLNWIDKLEVLNGELYAGGSISLGDGNVGNGIQKWNGSLWNPVGDNLQDAGNGYNNRIEVFDMSIHNGELYCVGLFHYAGHVPAKYLAKWTGSQWCGFGTTLEFNLPAYVVSVFNDTMFIGGAIDTINANPTEYVIKWIGDNFIDSCSGPDGINESELLKDFYCFPIPTERSIVINFPFINKPYQLILTSIFGQKYRDEIISEYTIQKEYDISDLASGIYFVTLQCESSRATRMIMKQ